MRSKSNLALALFLLMGFVIYCPTANSQTLKKLYLHASSFEAITASDEEFSMNYCGLSPYYGLHHAAAGIKCIAWAPLPLPAGTVITKVSPTWRDPGVNCELKIQGGYAVKSNGREQKFANMLWSIDSTKPVLASPLMELVDWPPNTSMTYSASDVDEVIMYDNAYYYLEVYIEGEPYDGLTNRCHFLGVSVDFYEGD